MNEDIREEKRNRILDEAGKLFSGNGIDKTKIIDIARAAGVAKGTVYEYFDSKEEIAAGWISKICEEFAEGLFSIAASEGSAREKLKRYIGYNMNQLNKVMVNTRIFFQNRENGGSGSLHPPVCPEDMPDMKIVATVLENVGKEISVIKEIFKQGIESGEFRKNMDLDVAALSLISSMPFLGLSKQEILPMSFICESIGIKKTEWTIDEVADMFIDGICV